MRHFFRLLTLVGILNLTPALAVTNNSVPGPPVMICNPDLPSNCIKPNSDGSINVNGGTGGGGTSGPAAVNITQTIVTLPANTSTPLIGSNSSRKSIRWMVTGTNPMTVAPGAAAVGVNVGMNYEGNSGSGHQGGSESYDAGAVPTNAFQAISLAGTTVTVWEGQ